MTNTDTATNNTDRARRRAAMLAAWNAEADSFGIDMADATADRRADTHRDTLRPFGR